MSVKLAASCQLPFACSIGNWHCRLHIQSVTGKWQLTSHSGCQFANSSELATGNWQPDANSILDGLRRLKLNRQLANGSQVLIHLLL